MSAGLMEFQEATAFVLPSLHEGFGLPAIEAQTSAYYLDPLSTAEMERVLLDRDLQSRLITLGARECKLALAAGLCTASRSPHN